MENPFPVDELARILPVLVLFGTGGVVLVVDLFLGGWRTHPDEAPQGSSGKWLLYVLSLLGVAGATVSLQRSWVDDPAILFQGALRVDLLSGWITAIILLGTFLTVLSTVGTLRRWQLEHGEFFALLFFAAGSMILLALSNNLILIFLSLETFSMAVYLLTAYTRDEKRSVEGALKYFVLGGLASGFLLLGLTFIWASSNSIRLDEIQRALTAGPVPDTSLLLGGVALTLIGFGFKVGAFPFHAWIPDVYEGAPTPVTAFMSVTVKAAGFAVLLRLSLGIMSSEVVREPLVAALWWVAMATMIFANLVALVQASVKRMLAYSAISHTGYLLVGLVAALSTQGIATGVRGSSVVFYLLPYTLMTFGAFALLASLGRDSSEGETFDSFRGLSQQHPVLAFCALVFMVSLTGIPPFAGFWGKLYLFRDAVQAGQWPLALVGVITSIISVYYYARLVVVMYMQPRQAGAASRFAGPDDRYAGWGAAIATAVAAAAIIALGLSPDDFFNTSASSVQSVLETARN